MRVLLAKEMRALDRAAEEEIGIPGIVLMENAGRAVADAAEQMLGSCRGKTIVIFAGKGNNGGDGSGAGRWLLNRGARVSLILAATMEELSGSAADQLQYFFACGGEVLTIQGDEEESFWEQLKVRASRADLFIDALLGTGFAGNLQPTLRRLCDCINELKARSEGRCRVLSVDIPTGVNADDGSASASAVAADETVTMALPKPGLYLYPGARQAGKVTVADIGMPATLLESAGSDRFLLTGEMVKAMLPTRPKNAHKGMAGRAFVLAGSYGYLGAAALSSFAAIKGGAGLVTLYTPEPSREALAIKLTEVMVKGLAVDAAGHLASEAEEEMLEAVHQAAVLALGPGLGVSEATGAVVRRLLGSAELPCVIDADALRALEDHTEILPHMAAEKVLTPHPGEMARITGLTVEKTDRDRLEIARVYAEKWQAVVVLKGVPTVIALPDGSVYLNPTGTPAMATAGCGDVLTGLIAALIAQGASVREAALAGVYLHGLAGEIAARNGIGMTASELVEALPEARNRVISEFL